MLSQAGPKLYYASCAMLSLGTQNRMRCGLSLAPCIVKRRRAAGLTSGSTTVSLAALGKHRRPRRPAGRFRFLGLINQGLLPTHLGFLWWLQRPLGDGLKGNCTLPPSSCSSRPSESAVATVIKRLMP